MDKEELIRSINEKLMENKKEILNFIDSKIEKKDDKYNLILTNFWEIFEKDKTKIVIPNIQRNYVQGNDENIRKKLIKDIFEAIENEKKSVNLDIIYGIKKNQNFIPIDGQQRLTTLFLLYWYVFVSEERTDLLEKIDITYENRASSREFFELLKNNTKIREKIVSSKEKSISKKIKNSTDFYASKWCKDITIKSALKMLDEIEKGYQEYKKRNGTDSKVSHILIDTSKRHRIFFRCKFLDSKDNSDAELYIKMNSRGKKLSEYEILKSQLENIAFHYPDIDYLQLCSNFDNQWANVFLENVNIHQEENGEEEQNQYTFLEKIERDYYNFLKIFITYYFIENALKLQNQKSDEVQELKDELINGLSIKFTEKGIYKLEPDFYIKLENVMEKIRFLYSNHPYEGCYNIAEIMDLEQLWKMNLEKNEQRERLYFYAIIKYLEKKQSKEEFIKNYEFFENWIRITRNYINSNYHIQIADRSKKDADSVYFKIMKNIKYLAEKLEKYPNIIEYFVSGIEEENQLDLGANEEVWLETERKKAKYLCQKSEQWTQLVIEADKDKYFRGINYFLFEFIEDENDIESFEKYLKVTKQIFRDEEENKTMNKFLIQRAMLVKGNYLKNNNEDNNIKTFYIFNYRDNTNTWIFGLNTKEKGKNIRQALKHFIDEDILKNGGLNYKEVDVKNRLQEIIDEYLKDSIEKEKNWRYYFIKDERLFNKCEGGNIKFVPEENYTYEENPNRSINLIRTARNSKHWDYLNSFLEYRLEEFIQRNNLEKVKIKYLGKTGDGKTFNYDNTLRMIYQDNEYVFFRKEEGNYKIQLKEKGKVYFSFNYDIKMDYGELNNQQKKSFLELFRDEEEIEIVEGKFS